MVRVAKGEFMRIRRILRIRRTGHMYPRCEHEEAAELVKWSKFASLAVAASTVEMATCRTAP